MIPMEDSRGEIAPMTRGEEISYAFEYGEKSIFARRPSMGGRIQFPAMG